MAHLHPVYDTDPHFIVDSTSRVISYSSKEKLLLVQGDHNCQRYTFEMPRYIDGHDMKLCDRVEVHYTNIDSRNGKGQSYGLYKVTDMQISTKDENVLVFSWLISRLATVYVGVTNFTIRFACTTNGEINYVWSTGVYTSVVIASTIDNEENVIGQYYKNLIPENIKAGVEIGGVVGIFGRATLNAPSISINKDALNKDILIIDNPSSNGNFVSKFKILIDGNQLIDHIENTFDLFTFFTTDGTHSIKVKCSGENFEDSDFSNEVTYTKNSNIWHISDSINSLATRLVLGVYNVVNGEIRTLAKSYTIDILPGMIIPTPDTSAMTDGVKFIGWLDDGTFNASDLSAITYGTGINPLSDRYGAVWQSATYASKDDVPPSIVIDETAKAFATVKFNFANVPEGTAKININTSGYPSVYNATTMKVANTASYGDTTVELVSWMTTLFAE